MFHGNAAQVYRSVGVETGVHASNPVRLVIMLYDGALGALADAKRHLAEGRVGPKCEAIAKAVAVIDSGLAPAVDLDRGGQIATYLRQLYDYMCRRLTYANAKNDVAALDEVAGLLRELRGAWSEIADNPPAAVAEPPAPGGAASPHILNSKVR